MMNAASNDCGVTDTDPWYHFVYDESWRAVATYRAAMVNSVWTRDQHPKEVFVHHLAGVGGVGGVGGDGGSLPMDFVAFRDREQPNPNPPTDNWPAAAGATLDERTYLCQNWRGDVVAVFSHEGILVNQVRYGPYGMPFGIPSIDFNGDGLHDLIDFFIWFEAYDLESTDLTVPRRRWADVNFDDWVDLVDFFAFQGEVDTAVELGRGKLGYPSGRSHGNVRRGYAGAELAAELVTGAPGTYHMRHRVYQADEGRWTRRDPIGYHDGMNLYEYVGGGPVGRIDPSGLALCLPGRCGNDGTGGPNEGERNNREIYPDDPLYRDLTSPPEYSARTCAAWARAFCSRSGLDAGCHGVCVSAGTEACLKSKDLAKDGFIPQQVAQRKAKEAYRDCVSEKGKLNDYWSRVWSCYRQNTGGCIERFTIMGWDLLGCSGIITVTEVVDKFLEEEFRERLRKYVKNPKLKFWKHDFKFPFRITPVTKFCLGYLVGCAATVLGGCMSAS